MKSSDRTNCCYPVNVTSIILLHAYDISLYDEIFREFPLSVTKHYRKTHQFTTGTCIGGINVRIMFRADILLLYPAERLHFREINVTRWLSQSSLIDIYGALLSNDRKTSHQQLVRNYE
ncbi:hypothetical protein NPIL_387691 [Nephila pilipes]|uniref:Uncharacterized protein n=1 Tax=Nephila pilipes TaxID=299642 RepID=A0A8X6N3G7_NEPPI|nr:hypothetical protein NPIL_387691 [Nephila pilipes]